MAEPKRVTRGWQVRYRTPDGASRKATFRLKEDAKAFQTKTENSKLDGAYVDRSKGRQLLGDYATDWLATRLHKPNTADRVESQVRVHIIPGLGHRPLAKVMPSEIQGFITKLDKQLAPGSVRNVYWTLQAIFNAAVSDRCIGRTPCVDVSLPRLSGAEIVPPTSEQAGLLIAAMPEKYRVAGWLAAGAGLRQGEVLGLTLDRVDFLRRQIVVDRQLITPSKGVPYLDDPKWESARKLPIPDALLEALAAYVEAFPPIPVPLTYKDKPVRPDHSGLLITYTDGRPVRRNRFGAMWRQTLGRVGMPEGSVNFHDLRHYYASVLLENLTPVKRVSKLLGHANVHETWKTYAHIIPDDGAGDAGVRSVMESTLRDVSFLCPAEVPLGQTPRSQA